MLKNQKEAIFWMEPKQRKKSQGFQKKSEEIFVFNVAVDEIIQEMDVDNNSTEGKQQRWISMRYSAEKAKTRAQ